MLKKLKTVPLFPNLSLGISHLSPPLCYRQSGSRVLRGKLCVSGAEVGWVAGRRPGPYMYMYMYMYVCVCVFKKLSLPLSLFTLFIFVFICLFI